MKKLKFKLEGKELNREQMKAISGGYGECYWNQYMCSDPNATNWTCNLTYLGGGQPNHWCLGDVVHVCSILIPSDSSIYDIDALNAHTGPNPLYNCQLG